MKTFNQFQIDMNERVNFKPIIKSASKLFGRTKPPRSIDPYFANRAVERGSMVRGFHGQSTKNITQYQMQQADLTLTALGFSDP